MKTYSNSKAILCIACIFVLLCVGCGKKAEQEVPKNTEEIAVEEVADSTETQQPVEENVVVENIAEESSVEEQVEDSTADLSNEEWVNSLILKVDRPTFLVFNEITGERKALEDGAEYTLVEGDELGTTAPLFWIQSGENVRLYNTTEIKYNCLIYIINFDLIDQNTEFTVTYNNRDGEPVTATVYLSK